ncbi:hypothetical protein ONS95_013842 [Cadophora gregata]|uniref:uncharacterized protein n=1 Tax=Cadophora gregata TaxID=51156 RepID=UPI0026DBD915|nr:uncharacterized protein ONS95_013842 [Cadophora gregata]KAK0113596.1 hypothetical protein ONS96_014451 [Cadophora gregata f. sp. sojae]KAK0114350.1 hypothetical protein ONS95_013842 [Cadophora gregata]
MLVYHGKLDATDSRDRIFAPLGLIDTEDPCHRDSALEPNYNIKLSDLLERVASHLIERYGIDIMAFATIGLVSTAMLATQPRILAFRLSCVPDCRTISYHSCGYFPFTNLHSAMDPAHRAISRFAARFGEQLKAEFPELRHTVCKLDTTEHELETMTLFSAGKGLRAKPYRVTKQGRSGEAPFTFITCSGLLIDQIELLSAPSDNTQSASSLLDQALDFIAWLGDGWSANEPYPYIPAQTFSEALVQFLLVDQKRNEGDENLGHSRLPVDHSAPVAAAISQQEGFSTYAWN